MKSVDLLPAMSQQRNRWRHLVRMGIVQIASLLRGVAALAV